MNRLLARLRTPRGIQTQWMMSGGALNAAAAFGSNLVLVRFIAPESFGRFAVLFSALGMFLALLSLRLGVQVIRMSDEELEGDREREYFSAMLLETGIAAALASTWLLATGRWGMWSALLLGSVMLRHFVNNALAFFERGQPYRRIAMAEGGSMLFAHTLAAVLAIAGVGEATLYLREAALTLVTAGAFIAVGGLRWRGFVFVGPRQWFVLARRARGIWLDGVFVDSFERVAVLLAGLFGSDRGAGLFFQARRLAGFPHQLLGPLADRLGYNWFSRAESAVARRRSLIRVLVVVTVPLFFAAAAAITLGGLVVPWIFGEDWSAAVPILAAISGMILFWTPLTVLRSFLIATHNTRYLLAARAVQFVGLILPIAVAGLLGWPRDASLVAMCVSSGYVFAFAFAGIFALHRSRPPSEA